jgi:8-oxo-dGTP diphosphatase
MDYTRLTNYAGTLQCPGGHLEYGESFADCAKREALEETGLEVGDVKFFTATNDVMEEGKHYVTIYMTGVITGENKVALVSQCLFCTVHLRLEVR